MRHLYGLGAQTINTHQMMATWRQPTFVVSRAKQPALAMRLGPAFNGLGRVPIHEGPNAFYWGLGLGAIAVGVTWFSFYATRRY